MRIGLTGGIASGKSTVANMLTELGVPVIDADRIAKEVVERGEPAYHEIVAHFGQEILEPNGAINRKKLGTLVFGDEALRLQLNEIVHPAVRKKMKQEGEELQRKGHKTIVLDIPLLYESQLFYLIDKVLLVYVDEAVQLRRLQERDQAGEEDARKRIRSQLPLSEKKARADAVINNNGSLEQTKSELLTILEQWNIPY